MTDLGPAAIVDYLRSQSLQFELLRHAPSGTSKESFEARKAVTGRGIVGAKALVVRVRHEVAEDLMLVVLRGSDRLYSRLLQRALVPNCGGRPRTSFAEPQEIASRLRGLEPGRVPPLGLPLLPGVGKVLVDKALLEEREIGFNAADFRQSVVMPTREWLKALPTDAIIGDLRQPPDLAS